MMNRIASRTRWTERGALAFLATAALVLGGCATTKDEIFPTPEKTMSDVWHQQAPSNRELLDARSALRRAPETATDVQSPYTRQAANEITSQFVRLPNPDLTMYVFPHLAGADEKVPVPGYSTIFPMFGRVQYALPGERTEDY